MTHTKGEWIAKENSSFHEVYNANAYEDGCDYVLAINVLLFKDSKGSHLTDENKANAKLIAAAPELLERLVFVERLIEAESQVVRGGGLHKLIVDTLKKATE